MKGWPPYSEQWFSNCVLQTSGISITCKAIRNAKSPSQLGENIWLGQGTLCFHRTGQFGNQEMESGLMANMLYLLPLLILILILENNSSLEILCASIVCDLS